MPLIPGNASGGRSGRAAQNARSIIRFPAPNSRHSAAPVWCTGIVSKAAPSASAWWSILGCRGARTTIRMTTRVATREPVTAAERRSPGRSTLCGRVRNLAPCRAPEIALVDSAPQRGPVARQSSSDNRGREGRETLLRGSLTWTFCRSPYGVRTRAATLRGWCPRPLDERAKLRPRRYRQG